MPKLCLKSGEMAGAQAGDWPRDRLSDRRIEMVLDMGFDAKDLPGSQPTRASSRAGFSRLLCLDVPGLGAGRERAPCRP